MKLVEHMTLPNQLVVEVWDNSRVIGADTVKVAFAARIRVEVKEAYFPRREQFELTRRIFGPEILFEHLGERTFVDIREKESVFREFREYFVKASVPYISRPHFPSKFVLSRYNEIKRNPWKYGLRPDEETGLSD